jgi:flagellar protein FlaG
MLPPINTNVYQKTDTEIQTIVPSTSTSSIDNDAQNSPIPGIDKSFSTGTDQKKTTRRKTALNADSQKASGSESRNDEKERNPLSQSLLNKLEQKLQDMHNIGFQFSRHEGTGKTMIKVVNKDTGDVIREIPPEKALDMAAKMDEMLGILFDQKA